MDLKTAASVAKSVSTVVAKSYAQLQDAHVAQKTSFLGANDKQIEALADPKQLSDVNDVLSTTVLPALPPTPVSKGHDGVSLQSVIEDGQELTNDLAGVYEMSKEETQASPFKKVLNKTLGRDEVSDELDELQPRVEAFQRRTERLLTQGFGLKYEPSDTNLSAEFKRINTHGLRLAVEQGQVGMVSQLIDRVADKREADVEGKTPLHIAAKKGNKSMVTLLSRGNDGLNAPDRDGRTPLYYAVASGHWDTVNAILPKGSRSSNVNAVDRLGCSILSLVLGDMQRQKIAYRLVECGASPACGVDDGVLRLILAAAMGEKEAILEELRLGVDVNGQDGFGYNALYEAARYGHCQIVELLIAAGASPNGQTGLGGDTALHGIVDKGRRCRALLQPFGSDFEPRICAPTLDVQHVKVVETLLKYGAQPDIKRWDGLTVVALMSRVLAGKPTGDDQILAGEASRCCLGLTLSEQEQTIIKKVGDLIGSPPPVTHKTVQGNWSPTPQKLSEERGEVCQSFKARVEYHKLASLKYRDFFVNGLIYNPNEEENRALAELEGWASPVKGEPNGQHWRWIHLSANNKRWVKDLIRKLYGNGDSGATKAWALEAFIDDSYQELRGSAPYARYRRPSIVKQFENQGVFSIVVPYFDMETEDFLMHRQDELGSRLSMKQQLEDAYRHGGAAVESLHLSCTLDQSYYMSLPDSSARDQDQVVYRFYSNGTNSTTSEGVMTGVATQDAKISDMGKSAEDNKEGAESQSSTSLTPSLNGRRTRKILMVSQLWLWKIDSGTIITAFPDRWTAGQEIDLLRHVTGRIWECPPATMDQMIFDILQQCVGFVDAPANAGLDDNLFDIFEQSIANVANNETIRYKTFRRQQRICAQLNKMIRRNEQLEDRDKMALTKAEDDICDISPEIMDLEEIKDIRDELSMIQRVLDDQKAVLRRYCSDRTIHQHGKDCEYNGLSGLEFRREKARRLERQAAGVETSLKTLLDLKQKQGNLNEARDTRVLASETDKRERAGAVQSQILFIFTGATVFYTPLAFVSSFFAVPSPDFARDGTKSGSWRWWQIFIGSSIAEIATLLAVAAYLYWISTRDKPNRISHTLGKRLGKHRDWKEALNRNPNLQNQGLAYDEAQTQDQDHGSDANLVEGQRTPGYIV